jgi:hypothetical protein
VEQHVDVASRCSVRSAVTWTDAYQMPLAPCRALTSSRLRPRRLWDTSSEPTVVAEALRPADHLVLHAQALFAVVIDKEAGRGRGGWGPRTAPRDQRALTRIRPPR